MIIYIDVHKRYISTRTGDEYRTVLYFEGKKCWQFLSLGYLFKEYNKKEKHFILNYGDKIAVMDFNGNILIPPIYKKLVFLENYVIATDCNNCQGLLERSNPQNILINFEYSTIKWYYSSYLMKGGGYLTLIKNKFQGVYSLKEERLILPICYPTDIELLLDTLGENLIGFHKPILGNGFMDIEGNVIFTFTGHFVHGFKGGLACISTRDKWQKIDTLGKVVEEGEIERDDTMYETDSEEVYYTEEDTWDTMTDGMYGDYPGDVDYELLGF